MKRYIDRAEAIHILRVECIAKHPTSFTLGIGAAAKAIEDMPPSDVVEVVRCRDCAKDGLFTCPLCYIEKQSMIFINHDPDFFCGAGERREDKHD